MQKNEFQYSYSALTVDEKQEVESIRRQYQTQNEPQSDLARLRALDKKVKRAATVWSLVLGIVGCLIFGLGFSMILQWHILFGGIAVGVFGCALVVAAYPIYAKIYAVQKKKYGAEILRLSEELLAGEQNPRS